MKFRIEIDAKDKKIPIGNRFMMCSLFKKSIEVGDKELFNSIYLYEDKKNKKIKDFTFAIYIRDFQVRENYIEVNGSITVTVSTPDYNLGIALYNGLLMNKEYVYKGYNLGVKKVTLLKEKRVNSNEITCKTLSPIFIRAKDGRSIDIADEAFEDTMNYICDLYLKTYRGLGLKERLTFTPINMRKVVVKEEIEGFKEKTGKQFIFINAYKGIFNLEGCSEDLQILLEAGLGYRRSEGFGLIDLI